MERLKKNKRKMQDDVNPGIYRDSHLREDFFCFLIAIAGVVILMYLYRIIEFLF